MRIVVCVKYVPDLQSTRGFADGRVVRKPEDGSMNELDEHAVEAALQLVEAAGGEVIALCVGGPDAITAVRRAFQLGVTTGVLVADDAIAGSDVFCTARVLAAAVRVLAEDGPIDLVLTGMAALDGLTSMMPTVLAAELGWAQLTLASSLVVDAGVARIERHVADAHEVVEANLPVLVSITDEANKPRFPNFKAIVAARSAEVTRLSLAELGVDPATVGAAGSRTIVLDASPRPPRAEREILHDTGDAGERLAAFLVGKGFV